MNPSDPLPALRPFRSGGLEALRALVVASFEGVTLEQNLEEGHFARQVHDARRLQGSHDAYFRSWSRTLTPGANLLNPNINGLYSPTTVTSAFAGTSSPVRS